MTANSLQRTRTVLRGTLVGLLQFGAAIALQILLMPLVLRWAGREALGVYAILIQVAGYLSLFELGLSSALGRSLSQAVDDAPRFRELLDAGFLYLALVGVAHFAVGAALTPVVARFFHLTGSLATQAELALLLLSAWGGLRFVTAIYAIALTALQDLVFPPLAGTAANALRVGYSVAALALGQDLVGLTLGLILAEALIALAVVARFARLRPQWPVRVGRFHEPVRRELYTFGTRAFTASLTGRISTFTDNIMVGWLHGPAVTSGYYNTQTPIMLAYNQVFVLATNAAPEINRLWANAEWTKLRDIFLRLQRLTLLMVAPVVLAGWFYLDSAVSIWVGPEQFGGQWLTLWVVLFAALTTVRYVAQVMVFASGDIRRFSRVVGAEAVANLALSIGLGAWLGPHGVALATVLAHLPTTLYVQVRTHRLLDISWRLWFCETLWPAFRASVPLGLAAGLLSAVAPPGNWAALGVHLLLLGAVHGLSTLALGLSSADRQAALMVAERALARFRTHAGAA